MNRDTTHCYNYDKDCPKTCYRAQITEELVHGELRNLKEEVHFPVSWAIFRGSEECPLTTKKEED